MKLTAKVKLKPTEDQFNMLLSTLQTANNACNNISQQAWDSKIFRKFNLHYLVYRNIRNQYGLSAQMTVRAIAKVADAYRIDSKGKRIFAQMGGFPYDNRILSWKIEQQTVNIWTLGGREKMPFVTGDRQFELLMSQRGETDLVFIKNEFYLFTTCDIDEPQAADVTTFLGIDLGIKNVAVDSDGEIYSGGHVNNIRARYSNLRSKLQSKGTDSAKRLLKQRRRKEHNFVQNINHVISKHIVSKAKDTGRGIALEDLKGIRERITVRKAQRRVHYSWSFHDLIEKIKYKAILAGVPVVMINPRNTSRECSMCGFISKSNRKTQSEFLCLECGHSENADINAARNIASRPAINRANVGAPLLAV